jgi:hypothetical protein
LPYLFCCHCSSSCKDAPASQPTTIMRLPGSAEHSSKVGGPQLYLYTYTDAHSSGGTESSQATLIGTEQQQVWSSRMRKGICSAASVAHRKHSTDHTGVLAAYADCNTTAPAHTVISLVQMRMSTCRPAHAWQAQGVAYRVHFLPSQIVHRGQGLVTCQMLSHQTVGRQ